MKRHARGSLVAAALLFLAESVAAQWGQWGGPERDFRSPATGLAEAWPQAGPRTLWKRALGPGYSSIVVDGGLLFTMYRRDEGEAVVALDAQSGATVWEHEYRTPGNEPPNSTPTIAGECVYTLGFAGMLCALDKKSGALRWSHDLVQEYGARRPQFGFATSPLAHDGALILPVGGAGLGVAAFALEDGELLWRAHDLQEAYASPVLIQVEGEAQVAVLVAERLVGLDPKSGALLWSTPIVGEQNLATPVWCSDGLLLVTAGMKGSLGLRFSKADGRTEVTKAWENTVNVSQTTVVRHGDHFYGSTGQDPQFFVTAMHAATGEIAWREPGLSLANLVLADGKLLLLDVEGVLALGTVGPEGWRLRSQVNLLTPQAFTAPALANKALYLRDLQSILAIDLGPD